MTSGNECTLSFNNNLFTDFKKNKEKKISAFTTLTVAIEDY